LLPYKMAYKFAQIEPYGFFIVMGLVIMHILQFWMIPIMVLSNSLLSVLVLPLSYLLG